MPLKPAFHCGINFPECPPEAPLLKFQPYAVEVTILRDPKIALPWPLDLQQVEALLQLKAEGAKFTPELQQVMFSPSGMETTLASVKITDERIRSLRMAIQVILLESGESLCHAHAKVPIVCGRTLNPGHASRPAHLKNP